MIDTEPKVGRVVFGKSNDNDGYIGKYGLIIEIKGQRIVYSANSEHHWMLEKTVVAVCDTDAERDEIIAYDATARGVIARRRESLRDGWKSLFTKVEVAA